MPLKQIRLDTELLQLAEQQKPAFLETSQYIGLLVQKALTGVDPLGIMGAGQEAAPSKAVNSKAVNTTALEDSSNACALPVEAKPIPPAQGKPIDPALEAHTALVRAFWRIKKGSKGEQAWKLLQTGLKAIQAAYGDAVVKEQLELAINGCWTGITLANYERFKPQPKPWQQEPAAQHPAHQVFKAEAF